jgi:hypothetical protein
VAQLVFHRAQPGHLSQVFGLQVFVAGGMKRHPL